MSWEQKLDFLHNDVAPLFHVRSRPKLAKQWFGLRSTMEPRLVRVNQVTVSTGTVLTVQCY